MQDGGSLVIISTEFRKHPVTNRALKAVHEKLGRLRQKWYELLDGETEIRKFIL